MSTQIQMSKEDLSNELKLLLAILDDNSVDDLAMEFNELLEVVNWNHVIELARHHRVFPYINKEIQKMKDANIPPFVLQMFQRDFYRNTLLMLSLSGEMEQIAKLFSENAIRTLFLKGPIIAADLYGDVSLRTSSDLDLLVPLNDLPKAEQLLEGLGYVKDEYIDTILNDWKWRHHHVTFIHPEKKIKVEIHWRLNPFPSKEPHFIQLWERKRKSSLINRPIYYLGREDLFLFLVTHGARHGWSRLRWLLDIKKLISQPIDWVKLTALLKKHQYLHLGSLAVFLCVRLFSIPLQEGMKPLLHSRKGEWLVQDTMFYIQRMINLHSEPLTAEVSSYHKKYLFSLLTAKQKGLFIASFLYPYPEDAQTLRLPKPIHFLYFPLRPVLWAVRKHRERSSLDM